MGNKLLLLNTISSLLVLIVLNILQLQTIIAIQVKEGVNDVAASDIPVLQTTLENKIINDSETTSTSLVPLSNQNQNNWSISNFTTIHPYIASYNGHIFRSRESPLKSSYTNESNFNEMESDNINSGNHFSPSPELKVPTEYSSQLIESPIHDKFLPIEQHSLTPHNILDQKLNGASFSPFSVKPQSTNYRIQPSHIVHDKSPWSLSFPLHEAKTLNNQYLPIDNQAQLKQSLSSSIDTNISQQYQNTHNPVGIYQPYPYEIPPNPQTDQPIIFPSEESVLPTTVPTSLSNEQNILHQNSHFILPSTMEPNYYKDDNNDYLNVGYLKALEGDMIRIRKSAVLRNLMKILATMVPIGLLVSAIAPHYITINPNITLPPPPLRPPARPPFPPPLTPVGRPSVPPSPPLQPRPPVSNAVRYPPSGNRFYRVFTERDFVALKEFLKAMKEEQKKSGFFTKSKLCEERYICEMALLAVDLEREKNSSRTLYKILWEISNELSDNNTPEKIDEIFKAVNKSDCERYHCSESHLQMTTANEKN